ncbi:MAG TPA: metallophosphoesterase [Candidatus Binatia bacterium]|nr:metallophosphoesterase [Candidatus Binatia bacterium]
MRKWVWAALLLICACDTSARSAQPSSENTFLIVADIHFNPMADAALLPSLSGAEPAQWEAILRRSRRTAFSQYGEDTNWWLLQSSLDQMRVTLPHPAFIMVNGDLLAHRFPQLWQNATHDDSREHYRNFVLKTVEFIALQFRRRFPATKILLTPGNNDDDCGDYNIEAGGPFLHDTAGLARNLARADTQFAAFWQALGSYDMPHPAIRGMRIIALNTVFFSGNYRALSFGSGCAPAESHAADDLFAWLESRLSSARQAHEKIWLMFHIPPGMDGYSTLQKYLSARKQKPAEADGELCASSLVPMWVPELSVRFENLLEKYRDTILASFAGHTHTDDFRVMGPSGSFVLISPPISPIYNQNPAYRTVVFAQDGSLLDSAVYYLSNLPFAGGNTRPVWKREYDFSREWKTRRIDAASLAVLYGRIRSGQAESNEWLKLLNVSSAAAYLPAGGASATSCAIEALHPETYRKCYCAR